MKIKQRLLQIAAFFGVWLVTSKQSFSQPTLDWQDSKGTTSGKGVDIEIDKFGFSYVTGYKDGKLLVIKYNTDGTTAWSKEIAGTGAGGGQVQGNDITVDKSGNVYVTGAIGSSSTTVDCITLKFDNNGNQQWKAVFDNPAQTINGADEGYALVIDNNGNVYVSGISYTGTNNGGPNEFGMLLLKYNADGAQQWAKFYNGANTGLEAGYDIALDGNGNVYATGETATNSGGSNIVTVRVDASSGALTSNIYTSPSGSNYGYRILINSSNEIFVGGMSSAATTGRDFTILKYTNGFSTSPTAFKHTRTGDDVLKDMVMDNGNIYATGYCTSNVEDILTVKLSGSTFTVFGPFNGSGNSEDEGYAVGVDANGNVYTAGYSRSGSAFGTEDYIIVQYNSSGTQQWTKVFNGAGNSRDEISAMKISPCGHIYVTGSAQPTSSTSGANTIRYRQPGLITTAAQLMMRDWYDDLGAEPNATGYIYQSPDLWVRRFADGGTDHQNPDYSNANLNKVYARVFNTGCQASTTADLHLFWTRARTDETWDDHWFYWDMTGSPAPNNWAFDKTTTKRPLGAEITINDPNDLASASTPVVIPAIDPLSTYVITPVSWRAPDPAWYDKSNGSMSSQGNYPVVCLLARLSSSADPITGEINPGKIDPNVRNSNNVVTRNTYLTDVSNYFVINGQNHFGTGTVGVNNDGQAARRVNLQITNISPASNPAFSNYGHLDILFDNELWASWGGQGSGFVISEPGRVVMSDNNVAHFNNFLLQPHSLDNIGFQFNFNSNISVSEPIDYTFELAQTDTVENDSIFSRTLFFVRVESNIVSNTVTSILSAEKNKFGFLVYPNPFSGQTMLSYELTQAETVSVELHDINGKLIKTIKENDVQQPGHHTITMNAGDLAPGIYFCILKSNTGQAIQKVIIQK